MRILWTLVALLSLLALTGCQARPAAPAPAAKGPGTHPRDPREIVEALQHHGLKTEWNGTIQQRIGVKLDWKRRRS